jgi:hypothetical protein
MYVQYCWVFSSTNQSINKNIPVPSSTVRVCCLLYPLFTHYFCNVGIPLHRQEMTKAPLALLVMGKTLYRKDLRLKNQFVEHMVVTEGGGDGIVNENIWKGTKVGNNVLS